MAERGRQGAGAQAAPTERAPELALWRTRALASFLLASPLLFLLAATGGRALRESRAAGPRAPELAPSRELGGGALEEEATRAAESAKAPATSLDESERRLFDAPSAPELPRLVAAPSAHSPARPPQRVDARLQGRVRALVAEAIERARAATKGAASASNVSVAVHVRELGRGGELVALEADRALRPASNMKLVTSAAALVLLGGDYHFRTRFDSTAPVEAGLLRGDLVVRAGADPLFDPAAEGEVSALLAPAVRALRQAGVERIAGDLVLDEGSYLAPGPGPGWPPSDQFWQEHCALCAGFSANAGCLTALVEAGAVGRAATVRVAPRAHGLEERLGVTSGARKSELRIAVGARGSVVEVRGSLPVDVPRWSARFAHPDPVALFGGALRAALAEGGIQLAGTVLRARGRPEGRLLAELRTPLAPLLAPINADSNNAVADQLFLALGAEVMGRGDREGGASAVSLALRRLGVPAEGLVQVDGSGLSREDRVSARQISALLEAVLRLPDPAARLFRESLARSGESGTLATRMRSPLLRGKVAAKTGWISGTSALSGCVETARGKTLVFSILIDYPRLGGLNQSCWKPLQDDLCETLAGWDG